MPIPYFGEICALSAALTWASALVLFKRSGESIPPLSLSLFKNVIGVLLLGPTMLVVGGGWSEFTRLEHADVYILILSGVIGIAIADTLLFYSLNLIGVGLLSIVECCYTPSVVLCAWLFLGEQVSSRHYLGGGLVLFAVLISSTHAPPAGRSRWQVIGGSILGFIAISLMAVGIVLAKPVLEHTSLLTATMLRLLGGTAIMAVLMVASHKRAIWYAVFRPHPAWRFSIPASGLGTYLAMILWVGGFKYTTASLAAILNQTSTIVALLLATLFLKEPFTKRKLVSAMLALGGVIVVVAGPTIAALF